MQIYSSKPESLRQLIATKEQAIFDVGKPAIDRDQTLKAFTELKLEENRLICEKILEGKISELKNSKDGSAQKNFLLAQKFRAFDKIAIETNLNESIINDAVWYYKIEQSKEGNELQY